MNFQQLNYCKQLAQKKSFVEAARACHVTQSTLSNGIAALEQELGVQLFTRTTRNVMVSSSGEGILPSLLDVLNAKAALLAKAAEISNPANQVIRIGISPLISGAWAELIISAFKQTNRLVNFVLREMNLSEMLNQLKVEQLDFVLGSSSDEIQSDSNLQSVLIHSEPLIFVPANKASHELHYGTKVLLKDIAHHQFVMVPDTCGLSRSTHALFRRNNLVLKNYPGHAMSYGVLQDWARIGVGSAIIPLSKLDGKSNRILIADKDKRDTKIEYCAIWKSNNLRQEYQKAFAKYLVKTAPKILVGVA